MKQILQKSGEVIATIAFMGAVVIVVGIISYIIFHISESATARPDEITTAEECRAAEYAWHSVDGCMTHDNFINRYADE